jgi:outer membrane protein assembly factor BamD
MYRLHRRVPCVVLLGGLLVFTAACTNKKVNNPLANVGSKQPDKVLFDRAMEAMKHNRFDVARMTLQTLINTYPDSEFVARAKLAVGDSWYAEGGSAAFAQAEIEYKDFETFFPNMPEAAEAQLKIANIHYQEMEKPDRDYTHAMRAEEEYRTLILQYPESKLVPEAKLRLLEVQEVLGEREFQIGRFYFLRQSLLAAQSRLNSLVERYPLYSHVDDALYLLGQSYESQINMVRAKPGDETMKARMIEGLTKKAADAYSRILTRYPLMDRAEDAKKRLEALHRPVPAARPAAIAQNKAEQDSRRSAGMLSHLTMGLKKHPDVSMATKVGQPPLVDPKVVGGHEIATATAALMSPGAAGSTNVSVEVKNGAAPPPNQPTPRSDAASTDDSTAATPAAADPNELKPSASPDANELKPEPADNGGGQALPPPPQVNEVQNPSADQASDKTSSSSANPEPSGTSSSKRKKKKGLHKLIPF